MLVVAALLFVGLFVIYGVWMISLVETRCNKLKKAYEAHMERLTLIHKRNWSDYVRRSDFATKLYRSATEETLRLKWPWQAYKLNRIHPPQKLFY